MALFNTTSLLPSTFRSITNQRFLGATLDQLFAESADIPIKGYIGRTFAPTFKLTDNYVPEFTSSRKSYQLEPGVVVKNENNEVEFSSSYIDLLSGINNNTGFSNNHQRLFADESYTFDGHFDYDKFVNYYNYYWLPDGPAVVAVTANQVPLQATYTVTKDTNIGGYTFSGVGSHPNLQLTLARGGTYKFIVDQSSEFWLQSQPGVNGIDPNISTVSTRQVFGVSNNGATVGEIIFRVPLSGAQDFYSNMPTPINSAGSPVTVNAAVTFAYTDIQNKLLSEFLANFDGIDGVSAQLQNKTLLFVGGQIDNTFWTVPTIPTGYENTPGLSTSLVPESGSIITGSTRAKVWQIKLLPTADGDSLIQIIDTNTVNSKEKVYVTSGKTYASNYFWLNNILQYNLVPEDTARKEYLYYQDGSDSAYIGQIKLVNNTSSTIDVANDILGKTGYTSPNGISFTNGLKIQFDTSVTPSSYASNQYYVDGVGTSISLIPVTELIAIEDYAADIDTVPDYITINRASMDRNPWSRYNRWFHVDVINAVATYNNTTADYGPSIAGRRPIIEFDADLQLFDSGIEAKQTVDYVNLSVNGSIDAFNDVEGLPTAQVDGVTVSNGDRVLFTNDFNKNIRNKIFEVTIQSINGANYINLVETDDSPVQVNQQILVRGGVLNAAKTIYYNGVDWMVSQPKTSVNQAPLFDLVDVNGYSFGDTTVYPDSTFTGTKFFNYTIGSGTDDSILGFPIKYQTFNNVGDISFSNFYDNDTFAYTNGLTTTTVEDNTGFLVKNVSLTSSEKINNWTKTVEDTKQYQLFTQFFAGLEITLAEDTSATLPLGQLVSAGNYSFVELDILPSAQSTIPYIKVYLNNAPLVLGTDYQIIKLGIYNVLVLSTAPAIGDKIDIAIFNNTDVSAMAYYQIPNNLEYNPLNENITSVTLGQIRSHYNKLLENSSVVNDNITPIQDLNVRAQGGTLLQHRSPAVYAMSFLNNHDLNFVNSVSLARKEYTKFKNKFLTLCGSLSTIDYTNPITGVDMIMNNINTVKNSSFPWYYSDMVPGNGNFTSITYSVLNVRQKNYEIGSIFDKTALSNRAILVWLNGTQLTLGVDYEISSINPSIGFLITLDIGDTILIRDYFNTDGNYVPETPTKLGLYPKFVPEKYIDNTYLTPIYVIRGHDGSITPAFGDFRDDYLLELELRIYNNIKVDYSKNVISISDVVPGKFRTTGYTLDEFNQISSSAFLNWAGSNNIDYTTNTYFEQNNPWTWNYGKFTDVVDGSRLQGSWRAIYQYWYDTTTPNLTPWEMLGFGGKPTWWDTRYGSGPYTSGNTLLWEDLEAGYIWNNGLPYTDTRYTRPGLLNFIPVDTAGNLLSPDQAHLIKNSNSITARENFQAGQYSPAEVAWRRSSDYPYALQLMLAVTKPAEYFSTQIDVSKFYNNSYTGQFSTADNKRLKPSTIVVNGDTTTGTVLRSSGYLNWITDRIKSLGIDPITKINDFLSNLSVQLNYKVAGFTDKNLITAYAEQTTPGSTNSSVIVPDANYYVHLDKSLPVRRITYSAAIVTKTSTGYSVSGYDLTNPYFNILPSISNNTKSQDVTILDVTVKVYNSFNKTQQSIPYGTEFTSLQQVSDFLISYERYLTSQGVSFSQFDKDLSHERNWTLSLKELLNWGQQGWAEGSAIVLNPIADRLNLISLGCVIDELTNTQNGNRMLDQNFLPIKSSNFTLIRTENASNVNTFQVKTLDGTTICFAQLNLIQLEHTLIFDNVSDFGDIFYVPSLGTRQNRLKISGVKTGLWSGALSAPGYVYNSIDSPLWETGVDYKAGDIVTYNSYYYTASVDIPASQNFDLKKWIYIKKSDIKTGLLPNFSHNSQVFENFYDVDNPPPDENFQNYSAGLIGFRQRSYLTDLGISVPTQTKFYQGYIKEKGTLNSINALTKANFNNVTGNISINEEWAFRVGTYGGVETATFKEFVLDQSVFTTSPVAFTSNSSYSTGNIIVNLNGNAAARSYGNIYNASNIYSTGTTIYKNRDVDQYITDLPTAGYVNLADTDHIIFNMSTYTGSVSTFGAGDKVWTAKDGAGNWNILRVNESSFTAIQVAYTLDSHAQLKFSSAHSFKSKDSLILKNFDPDFDGVYKVISVPNSLSVIIVISNTTALKRLIRGATLSGTGVVYTLDSVRFNNVTDFIDTPIPRHGWIENDRVWIDNSTDLGWGVYSFNLPWRSNTVTDISANTVTSSDRFGSCVKISNDNKYVYVGNPGNKSVQLFANVGGSYVANVTISNANSNFGTAIESKGNLLLIGSSTDSNVHIYRHASGTVTKLQTIKSANIGTVTSLSLSSDLTLLYIGDATNNVVEIYKSGNATVYSWANIINGTSSTQFGNVVKTNTNGNTVFVGSPAANNTYTSSGNVYVYKFFTNNNAFRLNQTISSQNQNQYARFGYSLDIDSTASNLYVGIPDSNYSGFPTGALERYVLTNGTYQYNQTIAQPDASVGEFGVSVGISSDAAILAVGSRGSATDEHTYFDSHITIIDGDTTNFVDEIYNSGVSYIFEKLTDSTIVGDTGKYVFVQELETDVGLTAGDQFGDAVAVARGIIVSGAPGTAGSAGRAYVFTSTKDLGWNLSRYQQAQIDVGSISRTFLYNQKNNNILAALDYIDPNKGKILNIVDRDIDFKSVNDPAFYNAGTGKKYSDRHWGPAEVGKIWWNLDTIRYIDYEQDALIYRLNQWGKQFPGSKVLVYEWVESTLLPSQYTGAGMPVHEDDSAYSTHGYVDQSGNIKLKYYFWVKNKDTINTRAGKFNSLVGIVNAIESPDTQGIPYISVIRDDTVSLTNVNHLLNGTNSVLHLGTQEDKSSLIHSEYMLVQEGNPASKLPTNIINKINDSLSGVDALGNAVPDPSLPVSQRYGISIRPRQSLVINRTGATATTGALDNIINMVNGYLMDYPVVSRKPLTLMNSSEPIPAIDSGEYEPTIDALSSDTELSYINTNNIDTGTKVLVLNDSTQLGKWSIYTFNGTNFGTDPTRVQSYKTSLYWSYVDWYDNAYDPTSTPNVTVQNNLDLGKLTLTAYTYVKVLDNGYGNFLIYYVDGNLGLNVVGIGNGTIQIGTDNYPPAKETRQILLAVQQEIFTDDIAYQYNNIFFTVMKYILSEQKNVDWMFKTSFINATQRIRKLEQFPSYIPDNQNFYLDYINEVKPYRTVIREFVVNYEKNDSFGGDITDFDLPSYWDANLQIYRSPSGEQSYDATTIKSGLYSQWNNNYTYKVVDVIIEDGGSGYILDPQITFSGGGGTGAEGYAVINGNGQLANIVISSAGSGYTEFPTILINGTGSGAKARAVLRNVFDNNNTGHNVVRSIKTKIKFDRISYTNSNVFQIWSTVTSGQTIAANTIIVLNNTLYRLSNSYVVTSGLDFPIANVTQINSGQFNEANDRIIALNGNVDLGLFVDGIDYPGVVVDGNTATLWTANLSIPTDSLVTYQGNLYIVTGNVYDTGGTFANVTSNLEQVDANNQVDVGIGTDSIIRSAYSNDLGVNPSDINIDGGAYVDIYSSHAPEELLPGRMYDSLSISVFSNVSSSANDYAFRIFDSMNQEHQFYRINENATTTLVGNLQITSNSIQVADVTVFPTPNPTLAIPGEIFIGAEKISYYQKFTSNNTIAQIRRSVNGTALFKPNVIVWSANTVIGVGNVVYYNGNIGTVTGNVFGNAFANAAPSITANITPFKVVNASANDVVPNVIFTTSNLTSNTAFTTTANVTLKLTLIGNITANVGDYLVQKFANTTIAANLRVLGAITTSNVVPAIKISGNITSLTGNTVSINGTATTANLVSNSVLGTVQSNGAVIVTATPSNYVLLETGRSWYTTGTSTPANGTGLISSTTQQATFLLAQPGYMP
jgi:hypothetical protein